MSVGTCNKHLGHEIDVYPGNIPAFPEPVGDLHRNPLQFGSGLGENPETFLGIPEEPVLLSLEAFKEFAEIGRAHV